MPKVWLLPLAAFLVGCFPLRETEVFYTPVTDRTFPPRAKSEAVPVVAESPPWKYEVIGRFATVSDRGYPFLYRALLHNARRQGADAVILRKLAFDVRRTYARIPARWEQVPQTSYYYETVKDERGQTRTVPRVYTTFVPVFRPAETRVFDVQWTDLVAEMIVKRGTPALAAARPAP